ncbi:MAG: hypothetical protein NTV84_12110, partial [Methanoregula sp.]|nr:hypothetical protein [Methanoregula sp.]
PMTDTAGNPSASSLSFFSASRLIIADIPIQYWTNCKLLSQFASQVYDRHTIKFTIKTPSPKRELPPIRATHPHHFLYL